MHVKKTGNRVHIIFAEIKADLYKYYNVKADLKKY